MRTRPAITYATLAAATLLVASFLRSLAVRAALVRRRGHLRRRRAEHPPRRDALRRRLGQQAAADFLHLRRHPVDPQRRLACTSSPRSASSATQAAVMAIALRLFAHDNSLVAGLIFRLHDGHAAARSQPRHDRRRS